jgi:hypothetical protein
MTEGAGQLLCHVFRGLNKQQEAQIFLDLNGGNMPSLIDRFNVRIVAGDKVAQQVDETLRAYGWKAGNGRGNGTLQSVGAAEKVHRLGLATDGHAELFQNTIMVITRAWQNAQPGVMAPVLEAISALLLEYGDAISTDRLIKTMANYSGGPHGLLEDGKQLARSVRGRPAMGIAMRLVDEYNTGLKTRKLTAWRKRR